MDQLPPSNPIESETRQIRGVDVTREDLVQLYEVIQEKSLEAAELEISNWKHNPSSTPSERQDLENEIRDKYSQIDVVIERHDTGSISSNNPSILDEQRFPNSPLSVKFDSGFTFRSATNGRQPRNQVSILVDYSVHKVFDSRFLPGLETPNNSNVHVLGLDQTWVYGTVRRIEKFFDDRKNRREWIHAAGIYDILIFFVFLPLGLWFLYRSSAFIYTHLNDGNYAFNIAVFIYVYLIYIVIFRLFFHYIRWAFPLNSSGSKDEPSKIHRYVIGAISIALVADIVKNGLMLVF